MAEAGTVNGVEAWLAGRELDLFPFQRETIAAYLAGESGLVHSATGSGKTLAAWLGPLTEALGQATPDRSPKVLWITPLRALANDIAQNLRAAAEGAGVPWEVALRTGDTSSNARARQRRNAPWPG